MGLLRGLLLNIYTSNGRHCIPLIDLFIFVFLFCYFTEKPSRRCLISRDPKRPIASEMAGRRGVRLAPDDVDVNPEETAVIMAK